MYYPFFRGKQFELLAIRESARLIASAGFNPIVEPVRETISGLHRTLEDLVECDATASVIVNPRHGDYRHGGEELATYLRDNYQDNHRISPAILLTNSMTVEDALTLVSHYESQPLTLIHAGFTNGRGLAQSLNKGDCTHVFLDPRNVLYRRPFKEGLKVLVEDGFEPKKNADYDFIDRFSDLHVTFKEQGADGYGDFLTIGDHYSEGGGPAYAVAIHLTFIDPEQGDEMFVYHFKSDSNNTPVDPAGKFSEALAKLVKKIDQGNSKVLKTSAVQEFIDLHERNHFPGLGYVKKLSLKHHLETLANYHAHE